VTTIRAVQKDPVRTNVRNREALLADLEARAAAGDEDAADVLRALVDGAEPEVQWFNGAHPS
jgi:hypothetical protein